MVLVAGGALRFVGVKSTSIDHAVLNIGVTSAALCIDHFSAQSVLMAVDTVFYAIDFGVRAGERAWRLGEQVF